MNPFIGAVVQTASVAFDPLRTIEKLGDFAAKAAADGAKLVVFPEAFVGGYPKGSDLGARVGWRTPAGREIFRAYYDGAVDVPGPLVERIGEIASANAIYLVTGVIEREGGTLYCTVIFHSPGGVLLGKHRKLMPTASERLMWGFGDGSTLPVFNTPLGKIGSVICWENYMPMLRMAMYAKGISLYCAPTADDREPWLSTLRHIALEGRCFVFSACQFTKRSDYPADYSIEGNPPPDTILLHGGSCIVGPLGQMLTERVFDQDAILSAEINLDEVARAKFDLDVVGHYARPDVFRLILNESSMPVMQTNAPAIFGMTANDES